MSEPKLKRLDIRSGRILAGGETYYIQYSLSTVRWLEYLKKIPKLSFGTSFEGLYDTLSKIYMTVSSGNDILYALQTTKELSINQLQAIKRFDENEVLDIVDLVSLFCNKSSEDPGKFDLPSHNEKALAIQNEGYDVNDFFLLLTNCINGLSEASQKIQAIEKGPVDLTLSLNTQQTESIS